MDRRTLTAVLLCVLVYLGWNKLYIEPRLTQMQTAQQAAQPTDGAQTPSAQTPAADSASATAASVSSAPVSSAPAASASGPFRATSPHAHEAFTLAAGTGDFVVGDSNSVFDGWKLRNYRQGLSQQTASVDLHGVTLQSSEVEIAFDDFPYLNKIQGVLTKTPNGTLWVYEDSNLKLTRETANSENQNYVNVVLSAEFKTKHPDHAFVSLTSGTMEKDPEAQDRSLLYFTNNSADRVRLADIMKYTEPKAILSPVKYIGATSRYFLFALLNNGTAESTAVLQKVASPTDPTQAIGRVSLSYPVTGNSITLPFKAYFGPKDLNILRAVDPTLDHTVDFGWFTIFAYPLINILKWLYQYVGNYGVAIILLTVMLKVATYPLTYKSMKSMKEMARLQPQLAKLREKYKDDKEALNREMLSMMKSHGYNPAAGCLPMLIQMPIFLALYRVLYSSIELYHAPFAFWIKDLAAHDPYYITPVLLSAMMFLQQKMTPNTATDPMQAKMVQMMPLIFGVFMIALPSGLTLYMLTNALATIVQQMILNKKFNSPGHVQVLPASAR